MSYFTIIYPVLRDASGEWFNWPFAIVELQYSKIREKYISNLSTTP